MVRGCCCFFSALEVSEISNLKQVLINYQHQNCMKHSEQQGEKTKPLTSTSYLPLLEWACLLFFPCSYTQSSSTDLVFIRCNTSVHTWHPGNEWPPAVSISLMTLINSEISFTHLLCDMAETKFCVKTTCYYMHLLKKVQQRENPPKKSTLSQKGKL